MLSLNDSIITGLLLPKYDLFHMANSLLWFVTIDYYDHNLDFLKIMNQHTQCQKRVSKASRVKWKCKRSGSKSWQAVEVGYFLQLFIYAGFSDASDASRLPGGWEQPSWNRHQWSASFPKVIKYWPTKSHLPQTWGCIIISYINIYNVTGASLPPSATCPSYSHGSKK